LDQTEHDSQSQENSHEVLKRARDALTQAMMDEVAATQVLEVEQDGQDLEPSAEVVEQIRQQAPEAVMANLSMQELQQPLDGSETELTAHSQQVEEERARESAQTAIFSLLGSQDEEEIAAVKIGAAVRGQQTRKRHQQESEALEMQDIARDNLTKALLVQVGDLEQEKHEEAAATKIAANVRGQQTRKRLEEARMAEERRERAQNAVIQALIEADEPAYYQPDLPTIPEGTCKDSTNVQDGCSNDARPFAGEGRVLSESEVACDEAMWRANGALRISFGEPTTL